MTGVAADADELVQDAFVRALEAPADLAGVDLERWLVRVATNLSLDRLRRRKRRRYVGPWLPSPVESSEPDALASNTENVAERVEQADEVSFAFLVALETLAPKARAVLLLTEVFDYPAAEVAGILETSEGNVRVLHHRARRTLDELRIDAFPSSAARERQRETLEKFVMCMMQQDAAGLAALLAEDVRSITDGGGRYTALREPLSGRDRVVRFHLETTRRRAPISTSEFRIVNGALALVVETRPLRPQMAPRLVLRCEVGEDGLVREVHTILAPQKLTAMRFRDDTATLAGNVHDAL